MSKDPKTTPTWRIKWWSPESSGSEEKAADSAVDAANEAQQVHPAARILHIELIRCPPGYEWPRG